MVDSRLGCFLIREERRKGIASSWKSLELENNLIDYQQNH